MELLSEETRLASDIQQGVSNNAPRAENKRNVESEFDCLPSLDFCELRKKWVGLHGSEAPKNLSPDMLKGAIAYHLQEQSQCGLSKQARIRLKALMASPRNGSTVLAHATLIKPGTKFLREWQNKVHEVHALAEGKFIYDGRTYSSLTIIAREITGTHQSGPKFFGLKRVKLKPSKVGKYHV